MDFLSDAYAVIVSILVAIYSLFFPAKEGFVNVPNANDSKLSMYPAKKDDQTRFSIFEPYLRQTETSNYDQRDNHHWPIGSDSNGALEVALGTAPLLPPEYPAPSMGGRVLHSKPDALARNKLTHAPAGF